MGLTLGDALKLTYPLRNVYDRYVVIPPKQTLTVEPIGFRVIFHIGDPLELKLEDGRVFNILTGDATSISLDCKIQYKSGLPRQEACNHAFIMHFSNELLHPSKSRTQSKVHDEWAPFAKEITERLSGFHHFPKALKQEGAMEILQQIRREMGQKQTMFSWKQNCLCLALIATLLRTEDIDSTSGKPLDRGAAAVAHACQYIEQHLERKLSLTDIAWQVQLSGEHLERLFNTHIGITVFEYLHRKRIEKAKVLLQRTELPISRVATASGYSSSNLLGRHFKSRTGMTPLSYRLNSRRSEYFSPSNLS